MDCYIDCANADYENGKYAVLDSMCFAEFLRYYYLATRNYNLNNNYHPQELTNKVIEENHERHVSYQKLLPLMSSNEKLLCRKVPSVLQYHVQNINTHPDDYYHMLILSYTFCKEEDLMCGSPPSYSGKIYNSSVLELRNHNQSLVEPYADLVHDAFQRYNEETQSNIDPFRQQENSEKEPELQDQNSNQDSEEVNYTTLSFNYSGDIVHQDHEISKAIRSLNK